MAGDATAFAARTREAILLCKQVSQKRESGIKETSWHLCKGAHVGCGRNNRRARRASRTTNQARARENLKYARACNHEMPERRRGISIK